MSFNFALNYGYFPLTGYSGDVDHNDFVAVTESQDITIKFYPIWFSHVSIEWTVPDLWGHCVFNVYVSPLQEGPYTKLTPAPVDTNFIQDSETPNYSKFNKIYYKVEAILDDGTIYQSTPQTIENKRNRLVELRANDITRREWLLMRKFVGIPTVIFRRRVFGKRCTACWNPRTEKVTDDKCPNCLGTSFEGGYFPGVNTLVQYEATPNNISLEYFGKFESNQIPGWTVSVPEVNPHDLVLRVPDWKIYRVEQINATELQTVTVRQILQLTELAKTSVEYKLVTSNPDLFPEKYK